jgi:hypothetical protein
VHYLPNQRAIVSSFGETLFTITLKAIDQIMQIPRAESVSPFTIEILTEIYQKFSFPQRVHIFYLFLPESAQFPKKIPPTIPPFSQQKVTKSFHPYVVCSGTIQDEWVEEPILGFLSIFSTKEKATTQFNFNQFLADNIHEQLFKFPTEGMF